jgi:HEAT repeat protein
MPSTEALNVVLASVAALWVVLAAAAVVGRTRRIRLMRRITALRRHLHELAIAGPPDPEQVRRAVRRVSPGDFQALAAEGLPADALEAAARALRHRLGETRMRRTAGQRRGRNIWRRVDALDVLAASGDERAYDLLDRWLHSGSPQLAGSAARLLTRLDNRPAAALLVSALADDAYSASRLAAAFERMTVPRADLLAPLFDSRSATARFWAARLSARLRAHEWTERTRELAADPEPLVRRGAVEALGRIGDDSDASLLVGRFSDASAMVRLHAARAAAIISDEGVADALTELLADREWVVRAAAREALTRMGGAGTAAVVRTLWHPDAFAANSAAEIFYRSGAADEAARRALRNAGSAAVLDEILRRFLEVGNPHLREAFLERLHPGEQERLLHRLRRAEEAA